MSKWLWVDWGCVCVWVCLYSVVYLCHLHQPQLALILCVSLCAGILCPCVKFEVEMKMMALILYVCLYAGLGLLQVPTPQTSWHPEGRSVFNARPGHGDGGSESAAAWWWVKCQLTGGGKKPTMQQTFSLRQEERDIQPSSSAYWNICCYQTPDIPLWILEKYDPFYDPRTHFLDVVDNYSYRWKPSMSEMKYGVKQFPPNSSIIQSE